MSLEAFINQNNTVGFVDAIRTIKNAIFLVFLFTANFWFQNQRKPEINSENGVKSQSDSYRTDVL